MEDGDVVPFGQAVEVVDPDVRAHVYSLVTAVRALHYAFQFVSSDR